ncbi:MAG: hypothetical protein GQ531_07900 [Sulfurovum sp.]|nr:hypothetical protein [Sulfurovum sp.]
MSHTLQIRAFFFNAKTDYLPYYKNFTLNVEDGTTAKELLALIAEKNWDFSYPKQKLIMNINGLVVEAKETVAALVAKLGTELTIEPANTYRANNGLKINDDDFMQSYALLAPYASEEDLNYYKTLYALHYASESENFDRAYIGDAILLLAHKMITEGSEYKAKILTSITSVHSGLMDCEYENNLFNAQDHSESIAALKTMTQTSDNEHPSLMEMIKERFCSKKEEKVVEKPTRTALSIENLQDKRIAYCAGTNTDNESTISEIITSFDSKEVCITRRNKLLGASLLNDNKTLALTKAGTTLLEAYDNGAEVLVIEDEASYDMIAKHFADIENVMGRKMRGLEVQLSSNFVAQAAKVAA